MTQKTVLTRTEFERAAIWLQLNKNYDRVMILQKPKSGIGIAVWARFFNAGTPDRYEEIEITDFGEW